MEKRMLLYRGYLKSCNYRCSYCPFSKHRISEKELETDRRQWEAFCSSLCEKADKAKKTEKLEKHKKFEKSENSKNDIENAKESHIGALMVVPYGEAMIHPWYWEGLARITHLETMDAAGIQTNLSFPVKEFLAAFDRAGGCRKKLRFWATFHPEMVSVQQFVNQCCALRDAGISLCAGAVGVPENLPLLRELRDRLPKDIYLWINKMDGLRRNYSPEEITAFQELDLFFPSQLARISSDKTKCENRLFVESDGSLSLCNISKPLEGNWYDLADSFPDPVCRQKCCSCYLASGGRSDFSFAPWFGAYPLFRIPQFPKAMFLDIDGTLIPKGCSEIPGTTVTFLEQLAERWGCLLFFATSLPYPEAMRKCRSIRHLFSGGIFASGAHLRLQGANVPKWECFIPLPENCAALESCASFCKAYRDNAHAPSKDYPLSDILQKEPHRFPVRIYENHGVPYKITLLRPTGQEWELQDCKTPQAIRYFTEQNCLQIVSGEATKENGVAKICGLLSIPMEDAAAAGDGTEDEGMQKLCGKTLFTTRFFL